MFVAATGVAGMAATFTGGATGCGACCCCGCVGAGVVVGVDGLAVWVGAGLVTFVFGLIRSGNSFGATTAHNHKKAIEITTATKIRFSI